MSISKKVLEHPVLTLCVFALIAIIAIFTLGKIKIAGSYIPAGLRSNRV